MTERLQQIFEESPQDQPRSMLDPYRKLIFRWRRQGRTYRRIRDVLAEKCGVETDVANVYRFARRRVRANTETEEAQREQAVNSETSVSDSAVRRRSPEEIAAERARIAALRSKPPTETSQEIVFVFDESKPITKTRQKG